MSFLSFEPLISMSVWWALFLGSIGMLVWYLRRRPPAVVFYGGPPRWGWGGGWERHHRRDWDGPGWREGRRWDRERRWRDDD